MNQVVYFTDCTDPNGRARMATAVTAHLGATTQFVPVDYPDGAAGAAMTLVDVLASAQPTTLLRPQGQTVILGNASPRAETHGVQQNGRQICWAEDGNTLVVITYAPEFFTLANRLGIIGRVNLLDSWEVLDWAIKANYCTRGQAEQLNDQFRGAGLIPFFARLLLEERSHVPGTVEELGLATPPAGIVARIDNFGNLFLDVTAEDVEFQPGHTLRFEGSNAMVMCYERLADIPPYQIGLTIGSSGYGGQRFLMAARQGGSLRKALKANVGQQILHQSVFDAAYAV